MKEDEDLMGFGSNAIGSENSNTDDEEEKYNQEAFLKMKSE